MWESQIPKLFYSEISKLFLLHERVDLLTNKNYAFLINKNTFTEGYFSFVLKHIFIFVCNDISMTKTS